VLLRRLVAAPEDLVETLEGTMVFVDVSGFTRLSERLARRGREGAEHLTDAINGCFSALLADAYANGGSLLKFGGDALLLWFDGDDHPLRGCASAVAMRNTIREAGRITAAGSQIRLRMSAGVHSGHFQMFLVGRSHREYLIAGPDSSRVVEMEAAASAGQVLLSPQTAAMLPRRALGATAGPGVLLARSLFMPDDVSDEEIDRPDADQVIRCLSTEVRRHVLAAPVAPEHRTAVVAFVQFDGLDELITAQGSAAAARALDALVEAVQAGSDLFQVCFLGSDVAAGGGKLILTAGAPRAVGDDDERMLLALRHVLEQPRELPVRIGVNRGRVFAGEIGPHYRRTYSVMGDTVNLAARLMSKAPWGAIYATEGVLSRSQTKFELRRLEPFMVKGKRHPIEAWEVGPLIRQGASHGDGKRVPLVGRDAEYGTLRNALAQAEHGAGSLIELIGETGSGKSRLLAESRELAGPLRYAHTVCENYRRSVPYVVWRDILRQLLGLHWDDPDEVVTAAIISHLETSDRDLRPWLPLLAIAFDVQLPTTREVSELAADYRTPKLHEVVLEFLEPLLAVPTLIQMEHAHFMDEASAGLLHALSGRLESSAWTMMTTRRDVTGGFEGAPESSTRITLGPLAADAMMVLAESTPEASVVPPDVLETAVQRAGGSPEFLLDLLAAAAGGSEALPDSMEAAATARIDELEPSDRILVRRASVLGICFHPRLLRHVLDPTALEPDEHTWSRMSGVFADDGDGYVRFKRAALCEAAYEGLPFRLRRQLHGAVGDALEPELGHDADADPAVLSLHFSLAGEHGRAWKYAKLAAERAVAKFAQADAARLYRRAIEAGRHDGATETELAQCCEALGDALMQSGDAPAAAEALTAARNLLRDDPQAQARLFLRHVRIAHRQARLTSAVRWGRRGLRLLTDAEDNESQVIRARLLAELAFVRYLQRRLREAERLCRTAIEQLKADVEQRPLAHASYVLDVVLVDLGRPDEAVHSSRALQIYEELGDREEQGHVLNVLAWLAQTRWQWHEALSLYARAGEAYERGGSQTGIAIAACNIGGILSDRGLFAEAAMQLRRARRIWTATGERATAAYATLLLGRIAGRRLMIDEARSLLSEAAAELRALGETRDLEEAEIVLAEAEAFGGDASRAVTISATLLDSSHELAWLKRIRAIALARLGQFDEAIDELDGSLTIAREEGALYDVAATLDVLQILDGESGLGVAERDSILAQLGIERLPELDLAASASEAAVLSSH
jgi:class 3 adenylate cyclase/tetratricopeptide (TPR) repeat protein